MVLKVIEENILAAFYKKKKKITTKYINADKLTHQLYIKFQLILTLVALLLSDTMSQIYSNQLMDFVYTVKNGNLKPR